MKKVILSLVLVSILTLVYVNLYAFPIVRIAGSNLAGFTKVIISSTTSTVLLPANDYRRGFEIANWNTFEIRISTYIIINQLDTNINNNGYPIKPSGLHSDNIEAYQGIIYGISTYDIAGSTVNVAEKSGTNY